MRTLQRSLMPAAIGATAIAWIARVLSERLVADRGDRSDSGHYMRTSLYGCTQDVAKNETSVRVAFGRRLPCDFSFSSAQQLPKSIP